MKKASVLIINSRHRYTLKGIFKELFCNLKNKHVHLPRRYGPAVFVDSTMSVKDEDIKQALTNIVNIKVIIASYIS
ncbi:MAG: hypothetical protein OXC46_05775 [Thaumarchaeota archaeon]|nr:hypothetical protein [Nitrososphaerota archaeon]